MTIELTIWAFVALLIFGGVCWGLGYKAGQKDGMEWANRGKGDGR